MKVPDLWDYEIYAKEKFIENLNEFKSFNIQINQILELDNFLIKDNEDNKDNEQVEKDDENSDKGSKNEDEDPKTDNDSNSIK